MRIYPTPSQRAWRSCKTYPYPSWQGRGHHKRGLASKTKGGRVDESEMCYQDTHFVYPYNSPSSGRSLQVKLTELGPVSCTSCLATQRVEPSAAKSGPVRNHVNFVNFSNIVQFKSSKQLYINRVCANRTHWSSLDNTMCIQYHQSFNQASQLP